MHDVQEVGADSLELLTPKGSEIRNRQFFSRGFGQEQVAERCVGALREFLRLFECQLTASLPFLDAFWLDVQPSRECVHGQRGALSGPSKQSWLKSCLHVFNLESHAGTASR